MVEGLKPAAGLQVTKSLAPKAWCLFPTSMILFPILVILSFSDLLTAARPARDPRIPPHHTQAHVSPSLPLSP